MDFFDYIGLIFTIFLFVCCIYGYGKKLIAVRKSRIRNLEELEKPYKKPEINQTRVKVIKKDCFIRNKGIKYPQSTRVFSVTFLSENRKKLYFEIDESIYRSIPENVEGVLATVNGEFYDFSSNRL